MINRLLQISFHESTPVEKVIPAPGLPLWIWILLSLLSILIITVITLLIRFIVKRPKRITEVSAIEQFQKDTYQIKISTLATQEFAHQLSLAIRSFLFKKAKTPSLFKTSEEFIAYEAVHLPQLEHYDRNEINELLKRLNELKYVNDPNLQCDQIVILTSAQTLIAKIDRLLYHSPTPASAAHAQ